MARGGRRVRFRVAQGGGTVNGAAETVVATGADGIAGVGWVLGAADAPQQVEAALLDAAGAAMHLPIHFSARRRAADTGAEPGFQVVRVEAGGTPLVNDAELSVERLVQGIEVRCSAPFIAERAFGPRKPVCYVTLYLPWPFPPDERRFWNLNEPVATHPIRLGATAGADDDSIFWNATTNTAQWLRQTLFQLLEEFGHLDPVLGYLTLEGHYIWARDRGENGDGDRQGPFLDGDVFGAPRADGGTDARLPSGDRRRGGRFEMWFHLVRSEGEPDIRVRPADLSFGVVPLGGAADESFTVLNRGTGPLVVSALRVDSPAFEVMDAVPFTVAPGEQRAVAVRFRPTVAGQVAARLFVESNDRNVTTEETTVGLFAEAIRGTTPRNRARVQVLHNALLDPVSVFFDDEQVVENLALGNGTPFFDARAGRRATARVLDAATGAEVARADVAFENGEQYALVVCGDRQRPQLSVLRNARENAENTGQVDVRAYNGLAGDQSTIAIRELGGAFALARCTAADAYGTAAPRTLNVVTVGANGQRTGSFDFDLREQAGRAFVLLSISIAVSDRVQTVVYGIDGQGRRILPLQLQTNQPGRLVAGGLTTRVGAVAAETRADTSTVAGVGEAFSARLAEGGIRNAGQLATLDAARVSALLGVNEERAAGIVREARLRIGRT